MTRVCLAVTSDLSRADCCRRSKHYGCVCSRSALPERTWRVTPTRAMNDRCHTRWILQVPSHISHISVHALGPLTGQLPLLLLPVLPNTVRKFPADELGTALVAAFHRAEFPEKSTGSLPFVPPGIVYQFGHRSEESKVDDDVAIYSTTYLPTIFLCHCSAIALCPRMQGW